ncbi:MAG: sensor histidine kinase [Vicinamibacterales bacterium]
MKTRGGVPLWIWIFTTATILALSSTAQAYRMSGLGLRPPTTIPIGRLLALNFTLWWVPAALTPPIFRFVDWLSRSGRSWTKSLLYHGVAVTLFSVVQFVPLLLIYATIWWIDGRLQTVRWMSAARTMYSDNLNWTLMTYSSIAAVGYAINFRRRSHQRAVEVAKLETQLVEARLGALTGELQPQFLYGALDSVSALVHTNPDRADRIISKLADFLRLVLNRTGTIVGPLQDELECVERYLEVEQIRRGSELSVRLEIDPDTLDAEFPPMTLHNLVELLLEKPTGQTPPLQTTLTIEASHAGESLSLRIRRVVDGSSVPQSGSSRRASRLAEIRERLQDLYGAKQDVRLNLDDQSSAISITVPFRTALVTE